MLLRFLILVESIIILMIHDVKNEVSKVWLFLLFSMRGILSEILSWDNRKDTSFTNLKRKYYILISGINSYTFKSVKSCSEDNEIWFLWVCVFCLSCLEPVMWKPGDLSVWGHFFFSYNGSLAFKWWYSW